MSMPLGPRVVKFKMSKSNPYTLREYIKASYTILRLRMNKYKISAKDISTFMLKTMKWKTSSSKPHQIVSVEIRNCLKFAGYKGNHSLWRM